MLIVNGYTTGLEIRAVSITEPDVRDRLAAAAAALNRSLSDEVGRFYGVDPPDAAAPEEVPGYTGAWFRSLTVSGGHIEVPFTVSDGDDFRRSFMMGALGILVRCVPDRSLVQDYRLPPERRGQDRGDDGAHQTDVWPYAVRHDLRVLNAVDEGSAQGSLHDGDVEADAATVEHDVLIEA
jgi:hypothetical protein